MKMVRNQFQFSLQASFEYSHKEIQFLKICLFRFSSLFKKKPKNEYVTYQFLINIERIS